MSVENFVKFVVSKGVFVYKVEKMSSRFCGSVFTKRWVEPYDVSFSLFVCPWIIIIIITVNVIIVISSSSNNLIFNIIPFIINIRVIVIIAVINIPIIITNKFSLFHIVIIIIPIINIINLEFIIIVIIIIIST